MEVLDIRVYLRENFSNKHVIYIPNNGNAGDSIIAHATLKVFKDAGIKWVQGRNVEYKNQILFYGGGGNFVPPYGDCKAFVNKNVGKGNTLVILPHTIRSQDESLKRMDKNVIVFCREKTSYNYCAKLMKFASTNLFLSKDLALYLNPSPIPNINTRILDAYRVDAEKTNIPLPPNNVDISKKFEDTRFLKDVKYATQTTNKVMEFIRPYGIVNTNRLHIAIISCIMGKHVNFHPNSYYKNKAVYDYSLKDFVNIKWINI